MVRTGRGGDRHQGNRGGRGRGRGRGGRGGHRGGGRGSKGGRNEAPKPTTPKNHNIAAHVNGGGGVPIPNPTNRNNNSSSRQYNHTQFKRPSPSPSSMKKNGEKGAEVHTVSEQDRIKFTDLLINFRENDDSERMEMSNDLTNTERKYMHTLAAQLGLKSKSTGSASQRRITITKIKNNNKGKKEDVRTLPQFKLGNRAQEYLQHHLQQHPPSMEEKYIVESEGPIVDTYMMSLREVIPSTYHNLHYNEKNSSLSQHVQRAETHRLAQITKTQHSEYSRKQRDRAKLPAYVRQEDICDTIRKNYVTIIAGDTGCGKSTQIPQFILDDSMVGPTCSIVVTQPRRISAISIAERVADERCEDVGTTVGYNVRLQSSVSSNTQLLFLTPGVLLRKFQSSPQLNEFTHIIIDEIHERDKYTEFLMIVLRNLMKKRSDLRVILMSATIETHELTEYWRGISELHPDDDTQDLAEISISGRTFPVQEFFLEDALAMTGYVNNRGDLSGEMDRLDADLAELLSQKATTQIKSTKKQSRKKNQPKEVESSITVGTNSSFTCFMCSKTGFKSPDELGTHIALCDGSNNCSMLDLEKKVKAIDISSVETFHQTGPVSGTDEDHSDEYDVAISESKEERGNDNDYDDYEPESISKWDGKSVFVATENISSLTTTLTEDEMLTRYQCIHDDEQIDNDLLLEILKYINASSYGDGAVLIFLPGWQEISEIVFLLQSTPPFNDKSKFSVLPLHSGISSKEQRKVFLRPPSGVRKIIACTNIAETSITIDDVAFVIDSGRAKEKDYDPHLNTSTLQPVWVSQASSKQRRGRAGRTKAGVCFHLFSRRRHASLREFRESELIRTSLEEICLQCKKLCLAPGGPEDDDGVPAFLAGALTAPHPKSVTNALELLVDLGAIDVGSNDLTQLGRCLSVLSLSPRIGKMVIWSYLLGCAKAAIDMATAMSNKSPFILPSPSMRKKADIAKVSASEGTESDQILIFNVLKVRDNLFRQGRKGLFYDYCKRNFINVSTINMMADLRQNLSRELQAIGFPDPLQSNGWHNRHKSGSNLILLQSTLAAGLYPNVATRERGDVNFSTENSRKAKIHLSSVNACNGQELGGKCNIAKGRIQYVIFGEMVRGVSFFTMNQTTHLYSVLPILLLCGDFSVRRILETGHGSIMSIDKWISYQCRYDITYGLALLRRRLNMAFWKIVSDPSSMNTSLEDSEQTAVEIACLVLSNH